MAGAMRIASLASASALLWLAGAASAVPSDFHFTDTDFTNGAFNLSSVFLASTVNGTSQTFSWTTSSRVDYVQLRNIAPSDGEHSPYMQMLAMAPSLGGSLSRLGGLPVARKHGAMDQRLKRGRERASEDTPVTLSNFLSTPTGGNVTIDDMGVLTDRGVLFFVALWEGGGQMFSRNFTVTSYGPGSAKLEELAAGYRSAAPHPEDQLSDGASLTPQATPSTTASSSATTPSQTDLSTPPSMPPAANVPSDDETSLAPTTIIGIVVGCAMGALLIITAAVWCFLFRREPDRLSKDMVGEKENYGHDLTETEEEKDEVVGLATQDSAGSNDNLPGRAITTDDGVGVTTRPPPPPPNTTTRPGSRARPPPYPHYQSRDSPTIPKYLDLFSFSPGKGEVGASPSPTTSITPLAADAAPHARSDTAMSMSMSMSNTTHGRGAQHGRYPHLVEDGMTDADIMRLEEEERELDAAIERRRKR